MDWARIYLNVLELNLSQMEKYLLFTEEYIVENPECIELREVIEEAKEYAEKGEYANARAKAEQAINACKDFISQVSLPKIRPLKGYGLNEYLVITTVFAFFLGLMYYYIKRRRFGKSLMVQRNF